MKKFSNIVLLFLAALGTVSCVKESKDDDEICYRRLRLVIDWVNTEPIDENESIPVDIVNSAGNPDRISSPVYGRDLELPGGTYRFIGWEPVGNVTLSGTTLALATGSDGTVTEPSPFSGGVVTDQVRETDADQMITLPFYQQTRPLIIKIRFTGYGAPFVDGVTSRLNGIAVERDIAYGFPPMNGTIHPPAVSGGFIDYTFTETDDEWFTGERVLLGMDGSRDQTLDIAIALTTGGITPLNLNVTGQTEVFHTENVENPMYIYLVLNVGIDLDMTIVDWYSSTDITLEAS